MARKRVIAYYMHEHERAVAETLLGSAEATDSFAAGEVEDSDIAKLRDAGVIVQDAPEPAAEPETAAWAEPRAAGAFFLSVAPGGAGAGTAAALDAAVPAEVDWYVVRLRGPLLEGYRAQLAAPST